MISQANGAGLRSVYTDNPESKDVTKKAVRSVSSQGDMSKVEQIKEALGSGEYKVNLQVLSEKIADELLS